MQCGTLTSSILAESEKQATANNCTVQLTPLYTFHKQQLDYKKKDQRHKPSQKTEVNKLINILFYR